MSWKAGDKAACVKRFMGVGIGTGDPHLNIKPNGVPQKGTIYLVLSVTFINGLEIAGLPCFDSYGRGESGWNPDKFRKIVSMSERIEYSEKLKR